MLCVVWYNFGQLRCAWTGQTRQTRQPAQHEGDRVVPFPVLVVAHHVGALAKLVSENVDANAATEGLYQAINGGLKFVLADVLNFGNNVFNDGVVGTVELGGDDGVSGEHLFSLSLGVTIL